MKQTKKHSIIIGSIISVLFIAPLIVLAVLYQSAKRENQFQPGSAEIMVRENEAPTEDLTPTEASEFQWQTEPNNPDVYSITKAVQIYDVRNTDDEYLRVRFVPMWYDSDGNVCGGVDEFSDFKTVALDYADQSQATELQFKNAAGTELLKLKLCTEPHWSNSWEYDADDQCFYFRGKIKSGDISATLLTAAQISDDVYTSTEGYELHIDVLADAIQTSADAKDDRW